MPFKSEAQRKYLFMKHPGIAKRWERKYGIPGNLPERARKRGMKHKTRRHGKAKVIYKGML